MFVTALLLLDTQQQMVFVVNVLMCVCSADRNRKVSQQDNPSADTKMEYKDFVWFLLAEEDKTSPRRSVHRLIGCKTTGAHTHSNILEYSLHTGPELNHFVHCMASQLYRML